MRLLVTIGLDEPVQQSIASRLEARVVSYPHVPRCYALDGRLRVESARVAGRWLEPDGVVFYSYFDHAREARRAMALAATPTFPDVRRTLLLDDKVQALVLAASADGATIPRGFAPPDYEVQFEGTRVAKWSDRHCGENKSLVNAAFRAVEPTVLEPFLEGTSERILIVGERVWQLQYESADWRKNVASTVRVVEPVNSALADRARATAQKLALPVAGIDYIVTREGPVLLEVNAYPGFDDVAAASEAFVDEVAQWWGSLAPRDSDPVK